MPAYAEAYASSSPASWRKRFLLKDLAVIFLTLFDNRSQGWLAVFNVPVLSNRCTPSKPVIYHSYLEKAIGVGLKLMGVIDAFFPRRCVGCEAQGQYLCPDCRRTVRLSAVLRCPVCDRPAVSGKTHPRCLKPYSLDGLVSLFAYTGVMRQAIKTLKFRFVTDMVEELADFAVEGLVREQATIDFFKREGFVVVPLPLHQSRERWRGFNQAAVFGRALASRLGLEFEAGLLERVRPTASQAETKVYLNKEEERKLKSESASELQYQEKRRFFLKEKRNAIRRENIAGAFKINEKLKMQSAKLTNLLLFDDVWTSGATMTEAGKVLKRAGVKQAWGMTLAQ